MNHLHKIYGHSLTLLTDLYQLSMASGYWKTGKAEQEAIFSLFFRELPKHSSFCIAAGLETALEYIQSLHFSHSDIDYLSTLIGNDGKPLFTVAFLEYLAQLRFTGSVEAIPEGTLVFPNEPLLQVQGPLLQCQLLETALLNIINFQTLIATKAARICQAAQGDPVLEFGLRRAQGIDGAISASRAAHIGGCSATSNVLAGKIYGIPVRGTHAHSWVMTFESELEAFQAYATAMPNNCTFLVDTYNTLEGIEHAIEAGEILREQGHRLIGIRLDSGDLVSLSQQARQRLDSANFTDTHIIGGNDLDEYRIAGIKAKGGMVTMWGIGTRLVTSYDQPALGGVYKLTALRNDKNSPWQYCMKLSEQPAKSTLPGILQVRRFYDSQGYMQADMIYDYQHPPKSPQKFVSFKDDKHITQVSTEFEFEDLLIPMLSQGKWVAHPPSIPVIRQRVHNQLSTCPEALKQLNCSSQEYPVGLEIQLHQIRQALITELRQKN